MKNNELLSKVGSLLDEAGIPFEFEDVNGRRVITLSFEGEASPEELSLAVDDPGFEGTAMNYLSIISADIAPETMEELIRILPDFNLGIRVGSFGVMADEGALYYNYSLLLDGLDEETVLKSIMVSLDVVTGVSVDGKRILLPLLKGEKTAGQLMEEDFQLLV